MHHYLAPIKSLNLNHQPLPFKISVILDISGSNKAIIEIFIKF